MDLRAGKEVEMPENLGNDVTGVEFSRSSRLLALMVGGDTNPTDVHILDPGAKKSKQITQALPPEMDPGGLVCSMPIRFQSFDGKDIPGLLYRPLQASAERKVPGVVWVHGGPGGQSRVGWRAEIQALCNHGFAVLAVNNRGSSGYGKSFYHLDDRRHGEDDLKDCIHARKYLEGFDWVRKDRVAIMGGSYGGFMVTAALAFFPDSFDCGIDIFGVTNWVRTLKSMPVWWEARRKALYKEIGDPATDEARLKRISPLFSADKFKRPLLVVQGANDPRVLKAESDELVEALVKRGIPVEYIVFDDEGHGFTKKANRITALKAYLDFLKKHLKGPL
jgi:dipeptidyl aminopeptidase/acylaminoacyl peptidase